MPVRISGKTPAEEKKAIEDTPNLYQIAVMGTMHLWGKTPDEAIQQARDMEARLETENGIIYDLHVYNVVSLTKYAMNEMEF